MRLFIHALGASAGGGLTYLRNVVPELGNRADVEVILLAGNDACAALPVSPKVEVLQAGKEERGTLSRFIWEQREIPKLIKKSRAEILISAGNFAVWNSPVPQILLSRNSLYTSADFGHDLCRRREFGMWADNRAKGFLARQSIRRAELTVAPSEAFARELVAWSGREVVTLHHGFNRELFFGNEEPLSPSIQEKLKAAEDSVSLLFVSHYNYYRNFETLLRAFALLRERVKSKKVRLVLTCELAEGKNPGNYRTKQASALLRELQIEDDVVQLGTVPYSMLHQVYRACDVYVTAAYTETFAHPLVEAMASGLPVVASDLAVHREITNGAALFFERFSATDLAEKIAKLMESHFLPNELREKGFRQSGNFSWQNHVDKLADLAQSLLGKRC